ncbi:MAG: ferrous iron transport protein A [Bacilli bacterium]|nr:ferrous iron transport protein A [Bacilli bacterium]
MNYITLDKIDFNEKYIIIDVLLDKNIRQRMYDFGVIENSIIEALYKSPFKDPTAYLVKETIIAIRNEDASKIIVRRI